MTSEQSLFLTLLADHINGTVSVRIPKKFDWEILYCYAKEQSLLGVCYVQLKKISAAGQKVPPEILESFHRGFFNDIFMAANQKAIVREVSDAFENEGLGYCFFKGWSIKDCWPVPELRTMGDIDILIRDEDRQRTDTVMTSLGYNLYIDNQAVWTYYKKDLLVETHYHMFYEHLTSDIDYQAYFDRAWDYAKPDLDVSYHFLYLITHMAKHTINNGMGFRAFMDLIFLCRSADADLHWDWICKELEQLKLLQFTKTCFALCRFWFGFDPPIKTAAVEDSFAAFVTEKTFSDGIFGLENEQNETAHSAKEITHTKAPYLIGAIRVTLHRLFPPYSDMQVVPWYSFIDGRPWLLPFAWVYRWGYCLVHKREQGKDLLAEPFAKRTAVEERQELIRHWGL